MQVSFLLFEGFEELDLVGPWEVLRMAEGLRPESSAAWRCQLVSNTLEPVRAAKGMRVVPDVTLDEADQADVLVIPGGRGTRSSAHDAALLSWIARQSASATWLFSICTGALLFFEAGVSHGRRVTTHWRFVEELRRRAGDKLTVQDDARYVHDGNLLSAAGVSAGIDAALWLVGQLESPSFSQSVQRAMEYQPEPPVW